jgi:hypothetical protein
MLLLLLVLLLAPSPASANSNTCEKKVAAFLQKSCECGWPINLEPETEPLAKGKPKYKAPSCPTGFAYKSHEQFLDLNNICFLLAALRITPLLDDEVPDLNFDVRRCKGSLVELCNLGSGVADSGVDVLPFRRLKDAFPRCNKGCRSCRDIAKLLAVRVCGDPLADNENECLCPGPFAAVIRPCGGPYFVRVNKGLSGGDPQVAGITVAGLPSVTIPDAVGSCNCVEGYRCDPGGPITLPPGVIVGPLSTLRSSNDVAAPGGK